MLEFLKKNFNKLFWKPCYEHSCLIKLYHAKKKPFANEVACFLDVSLNESFNKDNALWYHNEYIYKLKNVLIEPDNKICIVGFRDLILESFSNPKERPSLLKYFKFCIFGAKAQKLEAAILFDNNIGANYFHFFSDIISRLWLLEKMNFPSDMPFIIPKSTYDTGFFQYFLKNTRLKNYTWIVQDNSKWIDVKNLYLIRSFTYETSYWQRTRALINLPLVKPSKRVFINRSIKAGRYIRNTSEIQTVLNKYAIESVDTAALSFEEQIQLFSETELVIGVHGAGNANIMFCQPEFLKFIEIMPANRIACHYYWLSLTLNLSYDVIKGSNLNKMNSYTVDPILLEEAIKNQLNIS